jgi:hypothetical protein
MQVQPRTHVWRLVSAHTLPGKVELSQGRSSSRGFSEATANARASYLSVHCASRVPSRTPSLCEIPCKATQA